jgi:hypothetical protein
VPKKSAERVSSYIRINKGYKTKSDQVPRPLLQIDAQTRQWVQPRKMIRENKARTIRFQPPESLKLNFVE